jgi:poly(A) polymerase
VAGPGADLLRDRLWEGRRIWGATAAMLVNLSRRLELAREAARARPGRAARAWRPAPALGAAEGQTRFVGGCVRDTLLGLEVSDVDLATRLAPEEVIEAPQASADQGGPDRPRPRHRHRDRRRGAVRGHDAAARRRHRRPPRHHRLYRRLARGCRAARLHHQRPVGRSGEPRSVRLFRRRGRPRSAPGPLHRRSADPDRRGPSADPALLPLPRPLRRGGAGPGRAGRLRRARQRSDGAVAGADRRRADQAARASRARGDGPADGRERHLPAGAARDRRGGRARLERLVEREKKVGAPPDPLRRLAALLPPDPELAGAVAAAEAVEEGAAATDDGRLARRPGGGAGGSRLPARAGRSGGQDPARRRRSGGRGALDGWKRPRLAVGGGDLIAMGLEAGPVVARTLQAIEREWAESGFAGEPSSGRSPAGTSIRRWPRASNRSGLRRSSGRAKWKPWPCVQPSSRSAAASPASRCPPRSSPCRAPASERMARTIATESESASMPLTKLRSILRTSIGRRWR